MSSQQPTLTTIFANYRSQLDAGTMPYENQLAKSAVADRRSLGLAALRRSQESLWLKIVTA